MQCGLSPASHSFLSRRNTKDFLKDATSELGFTLEKGDSKSQDVQVTRALATARGKKAKAVKEVGDEP